MINALNLKLQVLITSFRLLKKPTQTYFLECKMLLIKYFSNTKAICFLNTGILFGRITTRQTSIAGNGRGTEPPARVRCDRRYGLAFGRRPRPDDPGYLYRLMVGLWYMHMYASQSSLRAQPWILLESKECRSSGDIFRYSPTSGHGVT